jgi:hypothetical protein
MGASSPPLRSGLVQFLYKHERPSLINLTVQAHFGRRPLMSAMLSELLHYMRGFSEVWFARHDDVAPWMLEQHSSKRLRV